MSVVIRCSIKSLSILYKNVFQSSYVTFFIVNVAPYICPQGGLSGLVAGLFTAVGVTIGDLISPSPPEMTRPLSLSTEGCNFTSGGSLSWTTPLPIESNLFTTAPGQNTDDM